MLSLAAVFAAFVLALEIVRHLPLLAAFRDLGTTSLRARRVLGYRRCLETRKESGLQRLSLRMLRQSLRGAELLALVAAPFALLLAADALWQLGITAVLLDWQRRLMLIVLGALYALLRFRFRRRLQPS